MKLFDPEDIERKTLLILRILSSIQDPLGSRIIARRMEDYGTVLSERTVRYHLRIMDEKGLTRLIGNRDGRVITEQGLEELKNARVRDKIGLTITRIENLAFRTTFDPVAKTGFVPVNISFFRKETMKKALDIMLPAFNSGISVSELVAVAEEGERIGEVLTPKGMVGLATVCSIVVNGVLLKNGIPMDSKFGGILQVKEGIPRRFVELIYYSGSSLDPSEAFIRARMTSVRSIIEKNEGKILANFREIPAACCELTYGIIENLKKANINGVFSIGQISEPLCQIPVDVNKVGLILLGGLNPIACAEEAGITAEHHAMSAVIDYRRLAPVGKLKKK